LGGAGTGIAHDRDDFADIAAVGLAASPISEILIERSIAGWKEYELEVMRDHADNCVVVCSIENLDPMGVHTGDSITVAPAQTLSDVEYQRIRDAAFACIRRIGGDTGGSNIQFAVNPDDGEMDVIEMNPRDRKSTRLHSSHVSISYAVYCLKKKKLVAGVLREVLDVCRLHVAGVQQLVDELCLVGVVGVPVVESLVCVAGGGADGLELGLMG